MDRRTRARTSLPELWLATVARQNTIHVYQMTPIVAAKAKALSARRARELRVIFRAMATLHPKNLASNAAVGAS